MTDERAGACAPARFPGILGNIMGRFLILFAALLGWSGAASAQIDIHFHSKDMASTFPHAFVRLTGTDDSTGQPIDVNYGFTPVSLSPAILLGAVAGMIQTVDPVYVSRSDRHFTLPLTADQHRSVLAVVEAWRNAKQPSYRLGSRNCTHFVAEIATALGLKAPPAPGLMKKPKSFLRKVTADNLALIERWPRPAVAAAAPPARQPAAPAPAPPTN